MVALPEAALFWPARRALLVADLHLEKASAFAAHGQMLPPYDTRATLTGLATLIDRLRVLEIWCLGDSFHDSGGGDRLSARDRAELDGLAGRVRWTWITGNHDAALPPGLGGDVVVEAEVDGLLLRHEADPAEARPEISGHFHPKVRVRLRGRHVSRRCFVASPRKIILPAFGALTGGLDAAHPEIRRSMGEEAEALVPLADRLLRYPIAA